MIVLQILISFYIIGFIISGAMQYGYDYHDNSQKKRMYTMNVIKTALLSWIIIGMIIGENIRKLKR
jgi:hypothetical protein